MPLVTRLLFALALGTLVSCMAVSSSGGTRLGELAPCAKGTVSTVIAGKRLCLKRGQRCTKRLDRQYHRYRFHCHAGRLTGGPKRPAPTPPTPPTPSPAGAIVGTIPAPATGGIAIGAGSVWVASTAAHVVTRIDPATNAVTATIPVGTGFDPFHGPTRLAFGHGTIWVLDGTADCSCVHRIDPASNRVVATIRLGTPTSFRIAPLGIAVHEDAIWIAVRQGTEDAPDGSVMRVDPATNSVSAIVGAGSSPEFGGPTRIAAERGWAWAGVPSQKAVVRVDAQSNSVAATITGLTCVEGDLAVEQSGVWVADCDALRLIDRGTNQISRTIRVAGASGMGAGGLAIGLGSIWVQAGPLIRINPVSGSLAARIVRTYVR
jgi:YVTN family beta-propeller protein